MRISFFDFFRKHIWLVGLIVLAYQAILLERYIRADLAPHYPGAFDQLVTYDAVYEAHFAIQQYGLTALWHGDLSIWRGAFKGWLVPMLGVLSTLVLGPQREAVVLVNFALFIVGQVWLWHFFARRTGRASALLACGLFLLSAAHYYIAGGIDDMRFDYAGLIVFGIAIGVLVAWVEALRWKDFWLFAFLFEVAIATRTTTMVYLALTLGLLWLWFGVQWLWRRDADDNQRRLVRLTLLGGVCLALVLIFFALNWDGFAGYYLNMKMSSEDNFRRAQANVDNLLTLLLYYPIRAGFMFVYYGVIAMLSSAVWFWLWRKRPRIPFDWQASRRKLSPVLLVVSVASLATYLAMTAYAPSPVVIGVLTMPLVMIATAVLIEMWTPIVSPKLLSGLATLVVVLGLLNYGFAMVVPKQLRTQVHGDGGLANEFYRDLAQITNARSATTIDWMLMHPSFHPLAFNVYQYEHAAGNNVATLNQLHPQVVPTTETDIMARLAQADVVIAFDEMPLDATLEYGFHQTLRETDPIWRPYLGRHFRFVREYPLEGKRWLVGLYVRQTPGDK